MAAPFKSEEGQKYYSAVNAAINTAFANRQVLAHLTRQGFSKVFGLADTDVQTMYEIGHNTCKVEKHVVYSKQQGDYEKNINQTFKYKICFFDEEILCIENMGIFRKQ